MISSGPSCNASTLPLRGAKGQRPTVCVGPTDPGRLQQVAHGRATRRRVSHRSGGAGTVHRSAAPSNPPSGSSATARRR